MVEGDDVKRRNGDKAASRGIPDYHIEYKRGFGRKDTHSGLSM